MKRMRAEAENTSWKMLRGARVLGYPIPLEDPTGKETQSEGTAPVLPGWLQSSVSTKNCHFGAIHKG